MNLYQNLFSKLNEAQIDYLIKMKSKSARQKDLEDLKALLEIKAGTNDN